MTAWVEDISGKRFALFGVTRWPSYHGATPERAIRRRGGTVDEGVHEDLDFLVIGSGRQKGRADAIRKGEKLVDAGAKLRVIDDGELVHLMRPDLVGARFAFAGGFDFCPKDLSAAQPANLVATFGAEHSPAIDADLDYLVIGDRRGKGKAAAIRKGEKLAEEGKLTVITEQAFLDLVSMQAKPGTAEDMPSFLIRLHTLVDRRRLRRALDMLKAESFNVFADVEDTQLVGVIRSQSRSDTIYSGCLQDDGGYECRDQHLMPCMGLQDHVCKHLIALVLGLVQTKQVDVARAERIVAACAARGPSTQKQVLAEVLLRYRAAEAGELDWRPTETVPEDFYAF